MANPLCRALKIQKMFSGRTDIKGATVALNEVSREGRAASADSAIIP
ncbi:hypothetical protein ACIBM4_22275 [Streptomyces sp. NPDC050256]